MSDQYAEAVARGAARLDEVIPDWYKFVPADLEMRRRSGCVIGNLEKAGLSPRNQGLDPFDVTHGFCLRREHRFQIDDKRWDHLRDPRWDHLRDLWLVEVNKRERKNRTAHGRIHRKVNSPALSRR